MCSRSALFALTISAIIGACGFVLNAATVAAGQRATRHSYATPARVVPPDPASDQQMMDLARRARVNMILYKGQFGQPAQPGTRMDAVAIAVVNDGR